MKKINVTQSLLPDFNDYIKEIESIWDTHHLTSKGSKHETLETSLQAYLEVENASLFMNGHLALESALEAFQLKGEIITTAFTFPSTSHAIIRAGCVPVFCDIKLDDYTLDPEAIEAVITDKTVAIMPVHVLGQVCDVKKIEMIAKKHNLKVIYDAAHVFGVSVDGVGVGNFGDVSMFSMNATKVFNTIEGGLLTYSDKRLSAQYELIKYYGMIDAQHIVYPGSNLKMNEFQAAMGLCNLLIVDKEIDKRKNIANRYLKNLSEFSMIVLPKYKDNIKYNYAYFPILITSDDKSRDQIYDYLQEHNINVRKYFYPLITEFECYKGIFQTELPKSKYVSDRVICLPLYGELSDEEQAYVIDTLRNAFKNS
jgi:dTDP-4-amino-4,6-dideoxygalactose transaminase